MPSLCFERRSGSRPRLCALMSYTQRLSLAGEAVCRLRRGCSDRRAVSLRWAEALCVAEMETGISDEVVLEGAMQTGSILVTQDKEFGEPVFRQGLATHGVILIRLSGLAAEEKAKVVSVVLATRRAQISGAFTVLSPASARIRRF